MKQFAFMVLSVCVALVGATVLSSAQSDSSNYPVMSSPELTTFQGLIETANLVQFFEGTGPFTAFAPSNSAFQKLNPKTLDTLKDPKHRDQLIDLINYHIILGKYPAANLKPGKVRTLEGKEITIRKENDKIFVNNAEVIKADMAGPNGVAHIIDTVLIP